MKGGANTTAPVSPLGDNSNRKVIFYDEKDEVDAFINKWFESPTNFKNTNKKNKIDVTMMSSKFKTEFTDSDNTYDKLLAKLFNKFITYKHTSQQITNITNENSFDNNYITPILDQLNNENDNTVAVFEYDLFLYNLDTILKKYKTINKFTKFFGNEDEDKDNMFIKHIKNAKNQFGVNDIIKNADNDNDNDSKKIKMYIPKLLTKSKSLIKALNGGSNVEAQPQPQPYDIKKLKKLENSNKTKHNNPAAQEIRRITETELWNTVLNREKTSHYGFEGDTPKNLMNGDFTLSNDKDKIELYFRKCNDLQQLYINKHIELLDIFKKMNEYINLNDIINDVIKKLVDPKYFNSKGKDGTLKLPKPEITGLQELLQTQKMVGEVVGDLNKETTGGGEGEEARQTTDSPKKDLKNKYVVDELVDYEFLQLIKEIQLSNETSIKHILGIKNNGKTKLDTLIAEYQNHINEKSYEKKKHNKTEDTWQSFNINNTNNLYFNNSNTLGETSSDPETIQKVIYKCYDLQILYLVKHIEVIEMFKLVYYYYDMMIKKIGILFFILSLYHKSDIDFTDVVIHLPLGNANIKEMLAKQTSLQSGGAGADTKEEIIEIIKTLKKEIEEYNKQENSKYKEDNKPEYKITALKNIEPLLLDTTTTPHLKLFNHLLTYFKAFTDNEQNIDTYGYIDKLLIKLLKTILPEIAETKKKYNTEEAKNIFNVVKNIYFDIIEQEINIQRKQDNVKKERSSYGVVKIGQFSKMDYDISKTIAENFKKIFEYRIKDEIDYSKDSYKNYTQQYKTLDTLTELLVNARTLLKEPKKKEEAKEVIRKIEESIKDLFNSVEVDVDNEEGTLVGGASSKLKYISDAINKNKEFGENDIPNIDTNENNDPQHIRTSLFEEYRLNFLELLKNIYFPKDNKVDFKTMDIDKEIVLLRNVLNRVRYKGQTIGGENDKSNVIYIKQSAFKVLKNQEDGLRQKKTDDEAERLAKLEAERLEAERLEAERLEAERLEAERKEAERQRLEAERVEAERLRKEKAEAKKTAERLEAERLEAERQRLEAERQKAAAAAKTAENAETNTKERQSILGKIQVMIESYKTKQEDEKINSDLEAYTIQLLGTTTAINGLILLIEEKWWKDRQSESEITDEDINIYNTHYSQLLSILQGSALIYVNLKPKPKQEGGSTPQQMFDVNYDSKNLTFKTDLCNTIEKYGFVENNTYELVFPEETNKNKKIYQTLFDKSTDDEKKVKFIVEKTDTELQKQELMTSIENGKSVVLFGFGFSGSGKTYTLIEGKADGSDTSILYQFIEKNQVQINSIEFLEIYPNPDKPTFFVGNNNLQPPKTQSIQMQALINIINPSETNNIIPNDYYNTITKQNETNISIKTIKEHIAKIEKYRREQLRILPTPNNPNSSRSFLQITIKLKDNGDKKGGQLVIFDMPGTESTVRIKEMMLGKESYVDSDRLKKINEKEGDLYKCNDFNEENIQDCFKFNKNALTYFIQKGVSINFEKSRLNQTICKELYKYLTYKNEDNQTTQSNKICAISNLFEGFDKSIVPNFTKLDSVAPNISSKTIYEYVTIKYKKHYDDSYIISSVQAIQNSKDTIKVMNVLFKYFILNLFKFNALDITIKHKDLIDKNEYIAKIGLELACFFNKKAYSTYNDYFKKTTFDEIVFLKDDDYKKIYDQFLTVILIDDNFSESDSDISLETNINDKENEMDKINNQKQKMMEVFEFTTITTPSNKSNTSKLEVQVEFKDDIFTQSLENIKKLDAFLNNKTHTKSIFIKYILFILSYIKQKSEYLKTMVFVKINKEKVQYDQSTTVTLEKLEELYNKYNEFKEHMIKEQRISKLKQKIDEITENLKNANTILNSYLKLSDTEKSASIKTSGKQTVLKLTNLYKSLNNSSIPPITETSKKTVILQNLPKVIIKLEKQLTTLSEKLAELNKSINGSEQTQMNQSKINYISAKAIYDIENMRLRASVYFIYKYIKFIVNQGSGIMTTLEHLKFFFLSRAGKIEKYNNNHESDKQKQFTIEDDKDIFNNEETYTNKEGEIEEKINIGQMKKYGLISILQSLAGDETNLNTIKNIKLKETQIPNLLTPKKQTEQQSTEQPKNTTKSKFIMLAHINPFPNTNEENKIIEADKEKKCKSASDTLAYIDSISANNLDIISVGANSGGSYRKKKYYKDINSSLLPTLKQHRIKRFTTLKKLNKNKKNLFTSKTKKLL
jgi:hypothetical protein